MLITSSPGYWKQQEINHSRHIRDAEVTRATRGITDARMV
jgi:hypothetical protein